MEPLNELRKKALANKGKLLSKDELERKLGSLKDLTPSQFRVISRGLGEVVRYPEASWSAASSLLLNLCELIDRLKTGTLK
ncbi:hypothetical protein HYT84_03915 [Candidatus Micrarchaeota archaeon]|nr:hypothetical protein [Candidatus Micrarchaeota archaeon]